MPWSTDRTLPQLEGARCSVHPCSGPVGLALQLGVGVWVWSHVGPFFRHLVTRPCSQSPTVMSRVSKAYDESRNLETQLGILVDHGIREELVFSDVASGRTMNRTGWLDLMSRVQPGDTIVVAFLDRFSRNFEKGVRIQAELTGRDIGIVAVRENIDTTDEGPAAKFFRRSMLAQGAYQVDSASERIKLGLGRARAG